MIDVKFEKHVKLLARCESSELQFKTETESLNRVDVKRTEDVNSTFSTLENLFKIHDHSSLGEMWILIEMFETS